MTCPPAFAAAPIDTTLGVVLVVPSGGANRRGKAVGDGDDCTSTVAGELAPAVLGRVGVDWAASEGVSLAVVVVVGVVEEAFELIMPVRVCWPAGGAAAVDALLPRGPFLGSSH